MSFSAVIAAAGLSSRMHEFKPLARLGNETFIRHLVLTLKEAGALDIIVVGGYRAEVLQKHLEGEDVLFLENTEYVSTTMFDSLCLGLGSLPRPADGIFLMPGDVPLVKSETIRAIAGAGAAIARPVFDGRVGHPVYFSSECIPALLSYSGENGLRGAVVSLGFPVTNIPVDDRGILLDADTPEDLKELRVQSLRNRNEGQLWMEMNVRIGRGDTVLDREHIQFLEMIDITGSIQTACGCMHMSYTKGRRMLNDMEQGLGLSLTERLVGESEGGATRLTYTGKSLVDAYNAFISEQQEQAQDRFQTLFRFLGSDLH